MIDFKNASELACQYLADLERESGLSIDIVKVKEEDFGWIFFYQSKKHLETNDFSFMLAGNAPFLIDRATADLHLLGTAHPIDFYIKNYQGKRLNMLELGP